MSTKDLAKDLESTVDDGDFLEFDSSGSQKGSPDSNDSYEVIQKIPIPKADDPSVLQVVFKFKNK